MVHITKNDLVAKKGASNLIHGTDQDDTVSIYKNMSTLGAGASNSIYLYNGHDNLSIGGKMQAYGGSNAIYADDGKKNITVKYGMQATKGGTNAIMLADNIAHFTAAHNLTIGAINAIHKGHNIISTGNGDDRIAFTGFFSAHYDGQNIIQLGDGSKHVSFVRGIDASLGGKNILDLGVGNQLITFGGSVHAGHAGKNQILSEGGNVSIHVKYNLDAVGVNEIALGEGTNKISIDGNMIAHVKGMNRLTSEGETTIVVGDALKSYGGGLNQIETGSYDDRIIIQKGLYAHGGNNQISTSEGNDKIHVKGHITASIHNNNIIETGKGNDVIHLDAHVARKSLLIDAGEDYDVLILSAKNGYTFKSQYQGWFSDMYHTSVLAGSGLEEIRVDIGRGIDLKQIDWLTQMVNQHNAGSGDDLAISLALDHEGARIDLGDIFTPRDEHSITILDLTGSHHNELRIKNTLASNGYDAAELRINGDSNDSVGIDNNIWSLSGGFVHENEYYYDVWVNAYGESLLIQDGIDIHVY